jgi:hypothetical protein
LIIVIKENPDDCQSSGITSRFFYWTAQGRTSPRGVA